MDEAMLDQALTFKLTILDMGTMMNLFLHSNSNLVLDVDMSDMSRGYLGAIYDAMCYHFRPDTSVAESYAFPGPSGQPIELPFSSQPILSDMPFEFMEPKKPRNATATIFGLHRHATINDNNIEASIVKINKTFSNPSEIPHAHLAIIGKLTSFLFVWKLTEATLTAPKYGPLFGKLTNPLINMDVDSGIDSELHSCFGRRLLNHPQLACIRRSSYANDPPICLPSCPRPPEPQLPATTRSSGWLMNDMSSFHRGISPIPDILPETFHATLDYTLPPRTRTLLAPSGITVS